MRYRQGLTIPAGTVQSDPEVVELEVAPGIITEVEINFPAGHSGLTYVQIYYQERQIFPTTPGIAFRGDDTLISFSESWAILEVPHILEIRGWSPSAIYDHTVFVDITISEDLYTGEFSSRMVELPEGFI